MRIDVPPLTGGHLVVVTTGGWCLVPVAKSPPATASQASISPAGINGFATERIDRFGCGSPGGTSCRASDHVVGTPVVQAVGGAVGPCVLFVVEAEAGGLGWIAAATVAVWVETDRGPKDRGLDLRRIAAAGVAILASVRISKPADSLSDTSMDDPRVDQDHPRVDQATAYGGARRAD